MKKVKLTVLTVILICASVLLVACNGNKKYFKEVGAYSFWNNKESESIAQYKNNDIVSEFLDDGEIIENNVVKNGKIKKVAYLGLDGVRADAMLNLCHDNNSETTNDYNNVSVYSGVNKLRETGGLYMAYSGGEYGKESQQSSSTSASWTSQFTGGWNTLHGIKENEDIKSSDVDTFFMKYAKKGLSASLAFDWGQLFDINLRSEVEYSFNNPTLPIIFKDADRVKVNNVADINGQLLASSLEMYNYIAVDKLPVDVPYDSLMHRYLLERIDSGDDIVGGIFHNPDSNGHKEGFGNQNYNYVNSVRTVDNYCYDIINAIKDRELKYNEEWLIIMTTDHGGDANGSHGAQVYEHRTTWIASNKAIDSKYFGKNYNGLQES